MTEAIIGGLVIALFSAILGAAIASLHFGGKLSKANAAQAAALERSNKDYAAALEKANATHAAALDKANEAHADALDKHAEALGTITSRVEVVVSELSGLTKDVDAFVPLAVTVARLEERMESCEKDVQNLYNKLRGK